MTSTANPFVRFGRSRPRAAVVAAGVSTLMLAVTGCSGADSKGAPPSVPASTTASPAPSANPSAAAKAQVLATYRKMWDAKVKVYQTGQITSRELEKYATDKALANIKLTSVFYQDHGMVLQGTPVLSPTVTALSLTKTPQRATISDCVDTTHFVEIYKATGKHVPLAAPQRHVQTSVAQSTGGAWVITDSVIERDRTC